MEDKDYKEIIRILSGYFSKAVLVSIGSKRELGQGLMKAVWKKYLKAENIRNLKLSAKMFDMLKEKVLVVTGSLYLAGKILKQFRMGV